MRARQLHRQFADAQYLYNNISEEDKERLLFDPDTGRWSGYKHLFGLKVRGSFWGGQSQTPN
jgi:hypothetical protein